MTALHTPMQALYERIPAAWRSLLDPVVFGNEAEWLFQFIDSRREAGAIIYPKDPFFVFRMIEPAHVRVVILGQDPYHGEGQAQGMAFSVPSQCKRPPSLRNILQEVARTQGGNPVHMGNDLTPWLMQGVLLLNTVLTVEQGEPASHAKKGWEFITDALIRKLALQQAMVFMLWGAYAQAKRPMIESSGAHLILAANHPSPLAANKPPIPFTGCGHFQSCNVWLEQQGFAPIDWASL